MRITEVIPSRVVDAVRPTVRFDITLLYRSDDELPLDVSATVYAGGKLIACTTEVIEGPGELLLRVRDVRRQMSEHSVRRALFVQLDERVVDFLEQVRDKSSRRDVHLNVAIAIRTLCPRLDLHPIADDPNRSLLRPGNMQELFEEKFHTQTVQLRITSSDWCSDYNGPWREQQFVVFELPVPQALAGTNVPLVERMEEALKRASSAQAQMTQGNWAEACEDLRPLFELFKSAKTVDLVTLLKNDGYTEDAAKVFQQTLQGLFDLVSKFIHATDTTGRRVQPEIRPQREDALLAYSLAMSLLNMIACKTARQR